MKEQKSRGEVLGVLGDTAVRVAVLVIVAMLFRVYFGFQNPTLLAAIKTQSAGELLGALLVGLRFDLSAIFVYNGVFFLTWVWLRVARAPQWLRGAWSWLFIALNCALLAFSFVDAELFALQGRFLSVFTVEFAPEYFRHPLALVQTHGLKAVVLVVLAAGIISSERLLARRERPWPEARWWKRGAHGILLSLVVIAATVVGVRGGVQGKPIGVMTAGDAGSESLAKLSLSSAFMLTRWRPNQQLKRETYFGSDAELYAAIEPEGSEAKASGVLKGDNVVIIVMESFSREYMGWKNPWPGHTPFLDQLSGQAAAFESAYANGVRSIEFPPSIFAGIPSWMSESYINSVYASNPVHAIPEMFRAKGYQTAFFHGVANGTMHFDSFMKLIGFESYFGMDEYPGPKSGPASDFDGTWGIWDGPYFRYFLEHLNKAREPFFYSVFSVSSHHPYALPPGTEGRYKEGEHPIHKVIAYSDDMLREFFAEAAKQPWFKHTLFVITGDHTSANSRPEYNTPLGRYQVPIIFYHGGGKLPPVDTKRLAQHIDIPASLMDLFGINDVHTPFTRSLFRKNNPVVINPTYNKLWIADDKYFLRLNDDGSTELYDRVKDAALTHPLTGEPEVRGRLERRLKANLQAYRNGMIDSSLFRWQSSVPTATSESAINPEARIHRK